MVLLQSGSALNSVSHVATEGHVDAQGQVSYMGPFWWLKAMQICVPCAATMVLSGRVRAAAQGHAWFCGQGLC